LGLNKIGVVSAQINTNLREDALLHVMQVVKPKGVLFTNQSEDGKIY